MTFAATLRPVADQTSASIDVDASPAQVMAVIADFEHYPEWVDSMKSAEVLTSSGGKAETARMVLDHPLVMDGSYVLQEKGGGTTVTYTLTVDVNLPMIGMFRRKAEKTIIDGALSGLKRRV